MDDTINYLAKLGINREDFSFISKKTFKDGGQYRLEVPGIQSPKTMETLLREASNKDITLHRITQTKGIMLLTDFEIKEMVNLAKKYEVGTFFINWA
jgi:hypothetical protein